MGRLSKFLSWLWQELVKPRGYVAVLGQRLELLEGRLSRLTKLETQLTGLEQKLMILQHKPASLEKELAVVAGRISSMANRPVELNARLDVAERRLNTVRQWLKILEKDPETALAKTLTWHPVDYKVALSPEGNNGPVNNPR